MKVILKLAVIEGIKPFFFTKYKEFLLELQNIRVLNEYGDIEIRVNGSYSSYRAKEISDVIFVNI